jgi:hypothetical protein
MLWGSTTAESNDGSPCVIETPHCKGNESQDTVTLLETVLMSTKGRRDSKKPRASGNSLDEIRELRRYMDEVKMGGDSRLPLVGDICEVAATVQLGRVSGGQLDGG